MYTYSSSRHESHSESYRFFTLHTLWYRHGKRVVDQRVFGGATKLLVFTTMYCSEDFVSDLVTCGRRSDGDDASYQITPNDRTGRTNVVGMKDIRGILVKISTE